MEILMFPSPVDKQQGGHVWDEMTASDDSLIAATNRETGSPGVNIWGASLALALALASWAQSRRI